MRPYLVLILDSFREAFASRVLWIVLALIALLLVGLAPLSYRPVLTTEFRSADIWNRERAVQLLAADSRAARPAAQALARAMPRDFQQRVNAAARGEGEPPPRDRLADQLNRLLEHEAEWYRPELWEHEVRLRELRELEEQHAAALSVEERRRRARLRIEAALSGALRARPTQSVQLTYAGMPFPFDLPASPQQFRDLLNETVLPLIVNFFLGTLAVLVAILVTAPVIPHLFQGGSLQLLLSKPLSRPLLLLAKFVGGCAFIFVCVTPLVVGLWLLAGLRFDLWNHRLLLCIPLFLFLFGVYYSVSALAGLVWRNAIVAVVVTVLFWGVCFAVRLTHAMFQGYVAMPDQIVRLAQQGETILAVTQGGALNRWDSQSNRWQSLIESQRFGPPRKILGPAALEEARIVAAQTTGGGLGGFGGGNPRLEVFDLAQDSVSELAVQAPVGTRILTAGKRSAVLAYGSSGLFRIDAEAVIQSESADDPPEGGWGALLGLIGGIRAVKFEPVGPSTLPLSEPHAMAVGRDAAIFVYGRGTLVRLESDQTSEYRATARTHLEQAADAPAGLAVAGSVLYVARRTGTVHLLDAKTLDEIAQHPLPPGVSIRGIEAAPDGEHALVLGSDGELRRIDADGTGRSLDLAASGEIKAIAWIASHRLLVAHGIDRVDVVDPQTGQVAGHLRPDQTLWRNLYAYVLKPLHTVFPRPGELGETVQAVVLGRSEIDTGLQEEDLHTVSIELAPWSTVLNNALFLALMLIVCCIYISRQDF